MVEWHDANSATRWHPADDTSIALAAIVSSGFLLAQEADRITLSGDLDRTSGNVGRLISIPTGGIAKMRVLIPGCAESGFYLLSDAQRMALNMAKSVAVVK